METNYMRGRRKEQKIVKMEREKGRIAFRSAGSRSPIDVVIIDKVNKKVLFIQSKPNSMSNKDKKRLENEQKELNNVFLCSFMVITDLNEWASRRAEGRWL